MSFWSEADERHEEIARTFYENIENTHPEYVTSRRQLCGEWESWCDWAATSVNYYEYRGPDVKNI